MSRVRTLCLLFLIPAAALLGEKKFTVMSYNVQNLFDDVHDGSEYREYDPAGGAWNTEAFRVRVDAIAEVIRKSVAGGPDIVALQEVESLLALKKLNEWGLADLGYNQFVFYPKNNLAANVAVMSRMPVESVHAFTIGKWGDNPVRDVLEVVFLRDGRRLHLFVCHLKSKTGGDRDTEPARLEGASKIARRVREILGSEADADILITGDFNESLDEYRLARKAYQTALVPLDAGAPEEFFSDSLFLSSVPADAGLSGGRVVFYEPWFELKDEGRGSYSYRGKWETIDHMLLSAGLFDDKGFSYKKSSFRVMKEGFLVEGPAETPRKWTDPKGAKGYSDHLPLLLTLTFSK